MCIDFEKYEDRGRQAHENDTEHTMLKSAEQTRLEITFGCPAFLCLMGCVWTWRGMLLFPLCAAAA